MRRQHGRAEHGDLVGGPDHRDGCLLQQPVCEHAGASDRAILTEGVADEDVLRLVEQQHGFAGGRQLLGQLQAVQPYVAVGLAATSILFGDRSQHGARPLRQGRSKGGLAGAGWTVEQNVHAALPARDRGAEQGGRYLRRPPEMREGIPGQGRRQSAPEQLCERVCPWCRVAAHHRCEAAEHVEVAVAGQVNQSAGPQAGAGQQRSLDLAGVAGQEQRQQAVITAQPCGSTARAAYRVN